MDAIGGSDNSGMYPVPILNKSQHLAHECAIGSVRYRGEAWIKFHAEYINMWNNQDEFLPHYEAIFAPKLACYPEYMSWFRLVGKPYLLSEEDRSGQPHTNRPQQLPTHPKCDKVGPSSTRMQESTSTLMPTPPSGQYMSSYSGAYANTIIFTQAPYIPPHFSTSTSMSGFIFGPPFLVYYTSMPTTFPMMTMSTMTYRSSMFRPPIESPVIMPLAYET
ncbi:hypothetical protein Gotur_002578 [Gossypium turneri]